MGLALFMGTSSVVLFGAAADHFGPYGYTVCLRLSLCYYTVGSAAVALTPQWKHYVSALPSDARCGTFAPLWTLSYLNTVAALSLTSIST